MTADSSDDERTVVRPTPAAGRTGGVADAGGAGAATGAERTWPSMEPTQLAGGPPSRADDGGNGLPVGTRLGEFEITALVGEGGFGLVYSAIDHALGRRVALKEYMPSALAARTSTSQVQVKSARHRETFEAGLKSFVNEARLLAQFDHPALVKVYRFWEANGTAYMVMPFLEGKTLRDILREHQAAGLPPPDEAWLRSVLGPLTEALLVIHAVQCYHRDIAPDNVMQLPNGRWLLLDFGAARRVIGDMTQALTVILKPGYAPVEQYAEIPGLKQGPWTDVYALAAVVYFAITGKTPPTSVGRMLNDTYVPLVQAAAGRYGEGFLAAVDRALAVRPEARTQSIEEFREQMGLGPATLDPYASQPLTQGPSTITALRSAPMSPPAAAAPAPARAAAPVPAPPAAPAPAVRPATPPAPTGATKGSGALVGIGIGAVVLGAIGFGVYSVMAPGPQPAPAPAPQVVAAAPDAPPAAAAATAAPSPAPVAAAPPVAAPFELVRELERVVERQTPGFVVRAEAAKTTLRIGSKDEFRFNLTSERDGYVYVLGHGPDGTLAQLVPNALSGPAVRLRKGQSWRFPTGDGFYLGTQEPPGPTQLLILVSARQRSFDELKLQAAGEIRLFPGRDELAGVAAARSGEGALLAGRPVCPAAAPCDDEYGAALLRFDTVR